MSAVEPLDEVWARSHPLPQPADGGKEERGRVLAVGGGLDMAGALMLAGVGALRAGAGKLQLATSEDAVVALSVAMPEARVLGLPQTRGGRPSNKTARILSDQVERCDALLIGPGTMGDEDGMARALLELAPRQAAVVDAGALEAIPEIACGGVRVLTPHSGEMAQLLDREKAQIESDPLAAAREAAERFGAIIVMKGARTYVVSPEGSAVLYAGGGPGLGVSGSGDVLAGVIAGLLARGAPPFDAAASGVLLHGEAGRRLARTIGPLGFLAREIPDQVPALLALFD